MQLFPPQFPISRALIFYSSATVIILLLIISGNIYFWVGTAIKDLQSQIIQHDAEDTSEAIYAFLSYHKEALMDLSRLQTIEQGVVQPARMRPELIDLMQGMTLLGTSGQLTLLDEKGGIITSSRPFPAFDYSNKEWVGQLMRTAIDHHWEISSTTGEPMRRYWRIAVPVFSNQLPQGILVAELDLAELSVFHRHSLGSNSQLELEIVQRGESVARFGSAITGSAYAYTMDDPQLLILYRIDNALLNKAGETMLARIILTVLVTAMLFFAASLYFANRLYVKPLKSLRKMVLTMNNDPNHNLLPTDQPLLEISALAKEYNWLIEQIRHRKKALLDANENLEHRIRERTQELQDSREALRILNESLEEQVADRTMELEAAQDRLVMQEKMASVGQLAAGLSHELNNPINFVRTNFATLVEDFEDLLHIYRKYRELTQKAAENPLLAESAAEVQVAQQKLGIDDLLEDIPQLFDESERGFVRIAKIIQSMRDFSRIDQGGGFNWANINCGIEDTLIIARNEYKYHAEVTTELGEIADIRCSLEQLNQVFLNLIVNSAHAIASQNREDKGLIAIRTWQKGETVLCEIKDDGPGIPAQNRRQVFEPFYTTKAPGQGTGLGLSISYDIIVHKHHGELKLHCPKEGGSIFTIVLPVDQKEEVTHASR